ncbi:MAG TPA: hypothetical protein VMV16_08605 [Solirubrobacteraceae bacterium]|nr:hypothetical protein [Solirubrobacteraceae bacterium]
MKLTRNIAVVMATLAFGAAPAVAIASNHGKSANAPGHTKSANTKPATTPDTSKSTTAYGRACSAMSRTHVSGQKGTPFSQCVIAMEKLAKSAKTTPKTACASFSKKHVKGTKGTPYSQCISAAAKLRHTTH